MDAGLDERGGDDRGRAADRAGGVHPQQRLAGRAERVGEVELGHHDALEQVGGLADDDRVDVVERQLGVGEGTVDGFAQEPGDRDVLALGAVVGLADADHGSKGVAHARGLHRADEVLLQGGAGGGVGEGLLGLAGPDALRGLADPVQPRGEHRVRGERAAGRVDADVAVQPERVLEDQLLVRERCVQLGEVDSVDTGSDAGRLGAGGGRQVAGGSEIGSIRCWKPVIHAVVPWDLPSRPCPRRR